MKVYRRYTSEKSYTDKMVNKFKLYWKKKIKNRLDERIKFN